MKKAQKEQAENIIRLLGHVHDGIKKAVERRQYNNARELLSQCQESAIELGETIEEIEGEGFVTVSYLENYCEVVYQAYALLSQIADANASRVYKSLHKALIPVENSVKNDIRIRREAVFLPYKASMWDSLESVWRAADADPDCDAYVIPIPYYDKNPDGSFREMHYEGEEYPEYVPVTWYEDYDFEERRPDMIFIHNPYDECNYVTSVHPFFYAKNLKQFTEKLVYIPYFILKEIDPKNREAVKAIAHFCTVPGTIYADKVIVQSEAMREAYLKVMTEFTIERTDKRGSFDEKACIRYWEEKLQGMGSPKIDKILNSQEAVRIPEEWGKMIQKADGSRKKVIFYNTSVTAFLTHGEKMLEKMQDVFHIFKAHQDEVALLWRPHPLMKATVGSMRPELWEKYEACVKQYCEDGWGIFDNTADVDRAVILCDGYYGDPSSVVQLCRSNGVPVMIQNIATRSDTDVFIPNDGMYLENDKTWFVGNEDGVIYQMNLPDRQVLPVAVIPEDMGSTYRISAGVIKKNQKLYCFPDKGRFIWIYDMEKKSFTKTEVKNPEFSRIRMFDKWLVNETIWCVSYGMNQIIEMDLATEKIVGYYDIFTDKEDAVGYMSALVGQDIYCVSRTSRKICAFDTVSQRITYYELPVNDRGFNTIIFDGKDFWLSGYAKQVYSWNKESGNIDIWDSFPQDYQVNGSSIEDGSDCFAEPLFYKSAVVKDGIIFIPCNSEAAVSNFMLFVNRKNMEIHTLHIGQETKRAGEYFVKEYQKDDISVVFYNTKKNHLEEFNSEKQQTEIKKMKTDPAGAREFWKENYDVSDSVWETGVNTIEDFFWVLLEKESRKSLTKPEAGKRIFEYLCE